GRRDTHDEHGRPHRTDAGHQGGTSTLGHANPRAGGGGAVLKLRGRTYDTDTSLTMAIVNRTPDSFYDKGATWDEGPALERVRTVVSQGADIVEIGGIKAAPGEEIDAEEEKQRNIDLVLEVSLTRTEHNIRV